MSELYKTLELLVINLGQLLIQLLQLGMANALLIFFVAWCLWGIDWKKAWPVLGKGGWAPLTLLLFVAALVWSRIAPSECSCLGFVTVPNFWWQLGAVGLVAAVGLFCGWLQGVLGWTPPEIELEPSTGHGHHGHGHH